MIDDTAIVLSACTSSGTTATNIYLTYLAYHPISHSTYPAQVNPDLTTTFAALVMDPHSKCVQVISGSACDTQVGFGCAAAIQQGSPDSFSRIRTH